MELLPRMTNRHAAVLALALAGALSAACESSKSATPLSPTIAGPIAGVDVSAPILVSPAANLEIAVASQPITLTVENAQTNGVRPVTYIFEVASDAAFATMVHSKSGVAQGSGGRTQYTLPTALTPERSYYWRAKADDGANASGYTAGRAFSVYTPVVIQAPILKAPTDGGTLGTRRPTLSVTNVVRSGPVGALTYLFEAAESPTMAVKLAAIEVPEGASGETSFEVPSDLPYATKYFWRVRAYDSKNTGPWSAVFSFVTPAAPPPPPPTPVPPTPGPTPGPAPGDELNLNEVTWVKGVNIAGWAVTSTITSVSNTSNEFCTPHSRAGSWPVLPFFDIGGVFVEGNQIMIANIGGKWYGGSGEWLRPGQVCKIVEGHVGSGVFYDSPPLQHWTPSRGELIGVAVSTPSRSGQWGTAERSNVVLYRWQ